MGDVIPNRRFPVTTSKQRDETRRRFARAVPARWSSPTVVDDPGRVPPRIKGPKPKR